MFWDEETGIKGYNIYRSENENGTYEKINDFIVSGSSIYFDPYVDELSEYYYKISIISTTGNERDMDQLDIHKAWTSLDVHAIYPLSPNNNVANTSHTSVSVSDVDGNSTNEIFPAFCSMSDGMLMGFYESGQELYNIDGNETSISGFAPVVLPELNGSTDGGELWSEPAIGDIDNDGNAEVFVSTYGSYYAQTRGYLFGFKTIDIEEPVNHPDPLWNGVPKDLGHRALSSPVLADLDGNGTLEIITNQERQIIKVFDGSGALLNERQIGNKWYSFGYLGVADLNFDGLKEIVIGTLDPNELYILNADLTDFNNINPIYTSTSHRLDANPVIADIDNDGEYEILLTGKNGFSGALYAFNIDGSFVQGKWNGQITLSILSGSEKDMLTPQPAVGDINNDGVLEVAIADKNNVFLFDNLGNNLPGFPIPIEELDFGRNSPILADIDNDNDIEIIVVASNDRIYAFNPDGSECVGWRLSSKNSNGFAGTPVISDIDNDGFNEIIISDVGAATHIWKTTGDANKIEWGSYRANSQNTGEYKKECVYSESFSKEITQPNTVWNTKKHIQGNLIVQPGADLTITSDVSFVGESKLIVKPGAKLILNGGRLTNSCGEPWQGIQVWGNSSAHQYKDANGNYQQGYVELKNDAVIENAWEAIQPWNPEHWDQTGGIINANGATFRNNRRAVQFINYQNFDPATGEHRPNQSMFRNCTFETTSDFDGLFNRPFHTFVSMYKVDGVRFYDCDFEDARTEYYPQFSQSVGIWTIDANFYVLPICNDYLYDCWTCPATNIERSSFTGLNIGVYATQSTTSSSYVIDRTDFVNNLWGNLNVANDNASIIRSDFEVGTKETSAPYYPPFGIINYGATGLTINQNDFAPHANLPSDLDFYTGIWNYNTGTDFNAIFKNDFNQMGYANTVSGNNNNPDWPEIGLNFQCNTNVSNVKYDFFVHSGDGIASYQGTEEIAAGNTFCHNLTPLGSDFFNDGKTAINYFYYNGNNENPENFINLYPETAPQNSCADVFGPTSHIKLTAAEKGFYRQQYYFNKAEYDNTKYLFEDLKDGGSTPATVLDIETAWPDETWELRAQLLDDSPHLSKEVLYAAADKTDVLPHTIMFEICIANPEEMRDEEFLDYLETKEDPMPTYMVDDLREGADEDTYKSVLQNEMAGYVRLWGEACNYLIRDIVLDTTGIKYDSLRLWLGNKESLNSAYEIVDSYMAQDSLNAAMSYLTDIPDNFNLTDDQLTEYNYFYDLKDVLITAQQQGRNILQLDSLEVLELVEIADTSNFIAGAQAQSILNFGYGYSYFMLPELPDEPNMKQSKIVDNNDNKWIKTRKEDHFIEAFPNPASTWVTFEYTLPYQVESANIEIVDISGKPVKTIEVDRPFGQTTWDTRNIKTGLYIYSLKVNNNTIDQRKLIINNK